MKATISLDNAAEQPVTMKITMTMAGWKLLKEQVAQSPRQASYPLWNLQRAIDDLVAQCEQVIFSMPIETK
jgi:hypothetical protein